jgi:alanine racemase
MIELPVDIEAKVGEVVTLLGTDKNEYVSAEDLARWGQTINYEVVTKINSILPRVVI